MRSGTAHKLSMRQSLSAHALGLFYKRNILNDCSSELAFLTPGNEVGTVTRNKGPFVLVPGTGIKHITPLGSPLRADLGDCCRLVLAAHWIQLVKRQQGYETKRQQAKLPLEPTLQCGADGGTER